MVMKTPPHPGGLIGDNLDELGITIVDAAKRLDVSRQQLHNLISGRSAITPEMAVKLENVIGSTADTWLQMQSNHDLAKVRKRVLAISLEVERARGQETPKAASRTMRFEDFRPIKQAEPSKAKTTPSKEDRKLIGKRKLLAERRQAAKRPATKRRA
jgi:addiction module HigA family antidote